MSAVGLRIVVTAVVLVYDSPVLSYYRKSADVGSMYRVACTKSTERAEAHLTLTLTLPSV